MSLKAASAALVALALGAVACSDDPKSPADAAASGAGSGVSTSGVGGSSGGASGAGTGGTAAGASGAAGSGGTAGAGPVICKIPDDIAVDVEDGADGGVTPCDVPKTIFVRNGCTSGPCHHTPNRFQAATASLDLMSPCVADRLVDKPSTTCNALPLIDSADVAKSFLLNKLEAENPTCGRPMPLDGARLPADQLRCVHAWIEAVVKASKK